MCNVLKTPAFDESLKKLGISLKKPPSTLEVGCSYRVETKSALKAHPKPFKLPIYITK
jgi:hypothetical protein